MQMFKISTEYEDYELAAETIHVDGVTVSLCDAEAHIVAAFPLRHLVAIVVKP